MSNQCYIFIGPSGSGKTSLAAALFNKKQKVVSHTTRLPRKLEQNTADYYFVSEEKFKRMIAGNLFAEYDRYADNYYGVSKSELLEKLAAGDCYDVLTLNGYLNLEKAFSSKIIIPVLLLVSKETVVSRLKKRGETEANIEKRLELFDLELKTYQVLLSKRNLIEIDADCSLTEMTIQFYQLKASQEFLDLV